MSATTTRWLPSGSSSRSRGRDKPEKWGDPVTYFIALLFIAVCIAPFLYIVLGGFRTNSQITTSPSGLPHPWVFSNYLNVLKSNTFWGEFANSMIVAVISTAGIVLLGLMVSFVIARYDFKLKGAMYSLFAAGLMFPMVIAITPLYIVVRNIGLMNSLAGVILPQIAFALPTTIIILVPFLRAIPDEIQEAAFIDGCSRLGFFWRMVLRLSMPGVITVGILAFIASWNSYLLPLFLLNNEATFTLPLGVQQFSGQYSQDTAAVLAFTSMAMLPAIVFFTIAQRRIVGGLTGAVKG